MTDDQKPGPDERYQTLGSEHLSMRVFTDLAGYVPALGMLCLRDGNVYATNGKIAVIVPAIQRSATDIPVIPGMGGPVDDVVIPIDALSKALKLTPKRSYVEGLKRVVVSATSAEHVLLSATNLETGGTIEAKLRPEIKYPDLERSIPDSGGRFGVYMNASLLKVLAAYVERRVGVGAPMMFWFDPVDPAATVRIEFTFEDHREGVAALAPLKERPDTPQPIRPGAPAPGDDDDDEDEDDDNGSPA